MKTLGAMALLTLFPITISQCCPTLDNDFESSLTRSGGCGDMVLFAVDGDDTTMLSFYLEGAVQAAIESGETMVTTLSFPSDTAILKVEVGSAVSDATCDDVIVNGGPKVCDLYAAISGTGILTVTPSSTSDNASASLSLQNVELISTSDSDDAQISSDTVLLESYQWTDVQVGWFPG